jgi:DNA-binding NarL/FixJ family response regulator
VASTQKKTRVFLVDDHPIVRRGLQLLIGLERDLAVCGDADNGPEALRKIELQKPDVAIIDLTLKESSGLDLIRQLHSVCPKVKLLVFSMRDETVYAERALKAGATGYITKEEGSEKAIQAIRALMAGKTVVSETISHKIMDRIVGKADPASTGLESLSDREIEILELLGHGLGTREISERLRVSIKTIESHREHLKTKLGLGRGPELMRYAFNWVHGESHDAPASE